MGCILETKKHLDFKVYPNQFKSPRLSSSVYLNSALWKRNMDPVRENKKIARQLCHQLLQDHVRHKTHGQKNKRRSLQMYWSNTNIRQSGKKAANMDRPHASTRKGRADTYLRII